MKMGKYALRDKNVFKDIRDLVERAAEMYPDRIAYSFRKNPHDKDAEKRSFIELRDDVRALSTEYISRGYTGKHCAVIGKFSYSWVLAYFSLLAAGAVIVPLDRDWLANDLADTVSKACAEVVFIDGDLKAKADVIAEKCGASLIYMESEEGETLDSLQTLGKEKFDIDNESYFNCEIDAKALALLVFTSGTTGKGKGVMLSQFNVLSCMSDVIPYVYFGRKTVGVLPPHHTYGSSVMLIGHMMIGCEIYISAGLKYVVKEFKTEKPEHLVLVPLYLETFYRKMQAGIKDQGKEKIVPVLMKVSRFLQRVFHINAGKLFFGKLREALGGEINMVISGGAPINGDILKFFEGLGINTLNGYGITECAPIIAVNRTKNVVAGSVGNILEIDDVKIAEPNEYGEGEICVKGDNVMLGYYNEPEMTAEVFDENGYFKTGDYGKFGKKGTLFITGRKKNLIILSNGKNVYPEEIESEFISVPGVVDIIVYEGQSKRGLEHNAIVAEIYPDKDFLEKNGIEDPNAYFQKFVDTYNRGAVPYKKIGVLRVRSEEFPKNTLRKILRFKLDMSID